jgi:signal transduction histidine kinase
MLGELLVDALTMRYLPTRRRFALGWSGWVAGAVLLVVLGIAGSAYAARVVVRSDERRSDRAFAASSADVASTLKLAIRHEEDLVVSASAFIVTHPNISSETFDAWVQADRVHARYPEVVSLVRLVMVRPAQLPAFAARDKKDPVGPWASNGTFQVLPPGKRPFYCLIDLSAKPPIRIVSQPGGLDLCSVGALGLLAARDSGRGAYTPFQYKQFRFVGVETPIYRGGIVPTTVAVRRATFMGWIGVGLAPSVLLERALESHPGTAVTLRHGLGSSAVAFKRGNPPHGAQSLTIDLHNGWTVTTTAATAGGGLFANGSALALLLAGIALSVLLGLFVFVLVTGRARALLLVHEQTLELQDQAAELRTTVAELELAQATKDEFLSLISHELRTPLTSIRGYAELLQEEELPDAQRDFVNVIDRNAARLISLVEDLLLMAQIQSGGLPLQLGEVILADLIARSGEAAQPFAAGKGVELEIETEPGLAAYGDPVRLAQVIDNLMSNAIKYTPSGGGVTVTMTHSGETATIAVTDTGIGIPEDERDQMFGRFFRTSNARGSGVAGTGLGLAITRGIVEAHGGTIGFDSVEGKGTTFLVTLPLAAGVALESAA